MSGVSLALGTAVVSRLSAVVAVMCFSEYTVASGASSGGGPAFSRSTRALIPSWSLAEAQATNWPGSVPSSKRRGKGLRQQADRVTHRRGRGLPFQLVHDDGGLAAGSPSTSISCRMAWIICCSRGWATATNWLSSAPAEILAVGTAAVRRAGPPSAVMFFSAYALVVGLAGRHLLLGHLFDGLADRVVFVRRGPGRQAAGLGIHGQAGRGDEAGEHQHERLRVGVAARVDDQPRLVLVVRSRLQLLDGLGDHGLIRLAGPGEDPAGFRVGEKLGLGQLLLQHRDRDLGRHFRERVRLELRFKIARRSAAQLLQRGLDLLVILRPSPNQDPPRSWRRPRIWHRETGSSRTWKSSPGRRPHRCRSTSCSCSVCGTSRSSCWISSPILICSLGLAQTVSEPGSASVRTCRPGMSVCSDGRTASKRFF